MFVEINGKSYALENRLCKKIDLMIQRCEDTKLKKDALLINEGSEGEGKTNSSIAEAGYIKQKTKRDIYLFFRVEEMLRFAQSTEGKIIIWDEPSLDSLSTDQLNNLNKDLMRLFMTIRKKRHFFIVNLTKFWKFSEYLVVDRCLGMVHMYSRKEIIPGRFCYIKKKNLEQLWNDHSRKKLRNYNKLKSFSGNFPEILNEFFDSLDITINNIQHATLKDYEREKDKSIESIGTKAKMSKKELRIWMELNGLKYKIYRFGNETKESLAKRLKIHRRTLIDWGKIDIKDTNLLGNKHFAREIGGEIANISNYGYDSEENQTDSEPETEGK